MFRKFLAAFVAMTLMVGGLFAEEIKGVFKKYEDGKVTISVDDKEKTYKVDKDAKVKIKKKEVPLTDVLSKWKAGQNGLFTVDGDTLSAAKHTKK